MRSGTGSTWISRLDRSTNRTLPAIGSMGTSSPSREGKQETDLVPVLQLCIPGRSRRIDAPEKTQTQVKRQLEPVIEAAQDGAFFQLNAASRPHGSVADECRGIQLD